MTIIPLSFADAKQFVDKYHRHHKPPQGHKFSIGLMKAGQLAGVTIVGRPVSRFLDNGMTLEITRLCTLGDRNACSKLYSACCRIAKEMGYEKIITYILESEHGASLKASGFINEGVAGGIEWNGCRNISNKTIQISFLEEKQTPRELKTRWVRRLK